MSEKTIEKVPTWMHLQSGAIFLLKEHIEAYYIEKSKVEEVLKKINDDIIKIPVLRETKICNERDMLRYLKKELGLEAK